MTVSRLRLTKTETRDFAEVERRMRTFGEPSEWQMSNATFFTVFVAILAVLAALALVLH